MVRDQSTVLSIFGRPSSTSTPASLVGDQPLPGLSRSFTPGPKGFQNEIIPRASDGLLLMDSEVATISMSRNNVTLIYLRFNPGRARVSRADEYLRM